MIRQKYLNGETFNCDFFMLQHYNTGSEDDLHYELQNNDLIILNENNVVNETNINTEVRLNDKNMIIKNLGSLLNNWILPNNKILEEEMLEEEMLEEKYNIRLGICDDENKIKNKVKNKVKNKPKNKLMKIIYDNCCYIAGGIMTTLSRESNIENINVKNMDIDIFTTIDTNLDKLLSEIINLLIDGNTAEWYIIRTERAITFKKYGCISLQIVVAKSHTLSEILHMFDISACAIGIARINDEYQIFNTADCSRELTSNIIRVKPLSKSFNFTNRLTKYLVMKNFSILIPHYYEEMLEINTILFDLFRKINKQIKDKYKVQYSKLNQHVHYINLYGEDIKNEYHNLLMDDVVHAIQFRNELIYIIDDDVKKIDNIINGVPCLDTNKKIKSMIFSDDRLEKWYGYLLSNFWRLNQQIEINNFLYRDLINQSINLSKIKSFYGYPAPNEVERPICDNCINLLIDSKTREDICDTCDDKYFHKKFNHVDGENRCEVIELSSLFKIQKKIKKSFELNSEHHRYINLTFKKININCIDKLFIKILEKKINSINNNNY